MLCSQISRLYCLFVGLLCLLPGLGTLAPPALAQQNLSQSVPVVTKLPYQKAVYNVAVFEAGPYWEFDAIAQELKKNIREQKYDDRVVFAQNHYFSPGWNLSTQHYRSLAQRIMDDPAIDMVVAMGSVASIALLETNNGRKPVLCLDVADPVAVGLIHAASGKPAAPNFYVDYVPRKWEQTITILDTLHHIQNIGTLYQDTPTGKTYSNVRELTRVGRDRGFVVTTYSQIDAEESVASCRRGIEYLLSQGIDSLYVPALNCFDPQQGAPRELYAELHKKGIKTYAKDGQIPVQNGALIGISTLNYQSIGRYFASLIIAHLPESPSSAKTPLEFEPRIFLNLSTARQMGIAFPVQLLVNVDGIYDDALPPIISRKD